MFGRIPDRTAFGRFACIARGERLQLAFACVNVLFAKDARWLSGGYVKNNGGLETSLISATVSIWPLRSFDNARSNATCSALLDAAVRNSSRVFTIQNELRFRRICDGLSLLQSLLY